MANLKQLPAPTAASAATSSSSSSAAAATLLTDADGDKVDPQVHPSSLRQLSAKESAAAPSRRGAKRKAEKESAPRRISKREAAKDAATAITAHYNSSKRVKRTAANPDTVKRLIAIKHEQLLKKKKAELGNLFRHTHAAAI